MVVDALSVSSAFRRKGATWPNQSHSSRRFPVGFVVAHRPAGYVPPSAGISSGHRDISNPINSLGVQRSGRRTPVSRHTQWLYPPEMGDTAFRAELGARRSISRRRLVFICHKRASHPTRAERFHWAGSRLGVGPFARGCWATTPASRFSLPTSVGCDVATIPNRFALGRIIFQ